MHTHLAATRSLLFVPGDSERKLMKAESTKATGLILDLEDSVSAGRLGAARAMVREYLLHHTARANQQLWVRINPLSTSESVADLVAVVGGAPDGVMLPKVDSVQDVVKLEHYLTVLEEREGIAPGKIRILAVATETAQAMFNLDSYKNCSSRLAGLTWGAEDLATQLGALSNRMETGEYEFTYQLARSLCLLGARAAGVLAIDTISTTLRDPQALLQEVRAARRAGFDGKLAIHPEQIDTINYGFAPEDSEIAHAQAVVRAFEDAEGGAGSVQLDGKMLDRPHLLQALRVLAIAGVEAG
ncbi:MAG: CoA ester lyase [Alcaligenaceae bacterium]|nr:CoA ester lyase [Alcaligenaceae bacterium]